jgi:hypothetical protein
VPAPHTGSGDTGLKIKKKQDGAVSKYHEEQGSRLGDIGLKKKQQDGTVSKYQDEHVCQHHIQGQVILA